MGRANTNAKNELIKAIGTRTIKCANIIYFSSSLWEMDDEIHSPGKELFLKVGYTQAEWEEFLKELDFNYDSGYGSQELYGTVWFHSEHWMERKEYDGSEWWNVYSKPEIPSELLT